MYIMGVYYGHNATAALLKNGKVLGCVSEERFNGIKNYAGFPIKALEHLLTSEKVSPKDLSCVSISHIFAVPMHYKKIGDEKKTFLISLFLLLYIPVSIVRNVWGNLRMHYPFLAGIGRLFYDISATTIGKMSNEKEIQYLSKYLGIERKKIKPYDHHLSHAAAAYYASSFNTKKALVLTADGEGDKLSATANIFEGEKITVIARTRREASLGYLYAHLTEFLGMKSNEHEYKVMGLAAYAKKEDAEKIYNRIRHLISVDRKSLVFHSSINTTDSLRFLTKYMQRVRFDLLAGAFQLLLERRVCEWVEAAVKKTGITTVVLSGGVFMNVKVNQRIAGLPDVKELFVIPACGDESSILGSSYLAYREACRASGKRFEIPSITDVYWGPSVSNNDVEQLLKKKNISKKYTIKKISYIEDAIATLLAEGNVVARMSGKMEFGARALGNRSILADPRNVDVVKVINEQVKNRDFWMPFAPAIAFKKQNDYMYNPKKIPSYFMMMTFDTTKQGKKNLKAAMHQYDETIRPQLVTEKQNPSFYKLIKTFGEKTGVYAVLNTSFNLHGYPIVLGPKEAIHAFAQSGLRYLAMENYLITKNT